MVAEHAESGLGDRRHSDLGTAVGALGQEDHGQRRCLVHDVGALAYPANGIAENDFAIGVLDNFTYDTALEAAPATVSHTGVEAGVDRIVAELFPVAYVTVQVRYVMPREFRLLKAEHTAEAPVTAKKAAVFVNFEICKIDSVHHCAPPIDSTCRVHLLK